MRGVSQALSRGLDASPMLRTFSAGFQKVGGVAQSAVGTIRSGLTRLKDSFSSTELKSDALSSSLKRIGAAGAALGAAAGISQLGSEIANVASSTQEIGRAHV